MHETSTGLTVGFHLTMRARTNPLSPERRAIERLKRKATGMAITVADEVSLADEFDERPNLELVPVQLTRGRSCRCSDAEVMAYCEGEEWICHTCGHGLSAAASSLLAFGSRTLAGSQSSGCPPPRPEEDRSGSATADESRSTPPGSPRKG